MRDKTNVHVIIYDFETDFHKREDEFELLQKHFPETDFYYTDTKTLSKSTGIPKRNFKGKDKVWHASSVGALFLETGQEGDPNIKYHMHFIRTPTRASPYVESVMESYLTSYIKGLNKNKNDLVILNASVGESKVKGRRVKGKTDMEETLERVGKQTGAVVFKAVVNHDTLIDTPKRPIFNTGYFRILNRSMGDLLSGEKTTTTTGGIPQTVEFPDSDIPVPQLSTKTVGESYDASNAYETNLKYNRGRINPFFKGMLTTDKRVPNEKRVNQTTDVYSGYASASAPRFAGFITRAFVYMTQQAIASGDLDLSDVNTQRFMNLVMYETSKLLQTDINDKKDPFGKTHSRKDVAIALREGFDKVVVGMLDNVKEVALEGMTLKEPNNKVLGIHEEGVTASIANGNFDLGSSYDK